jgi:hypothetical protein
MEEAMLNKVAAIGLVLVSFSSAIPMDGPNSNDPVMA